jgi:hypothetical protein
VDEATGKIQLKDTAYVFHVIGANDKNKTTIEVLDPKNKVVFTQTASFPDNFSIEKSDVLDTITDDGIYVKVEQEGADVIKNTSLVPGIPYGAYIVDAQKKPLAGISRDGNVYIMNTSLSLKYRETGTNISYLLVNSENKIIAEILLKLKAEYVVK